LATLARTPAQKRVRCLITQESGRWGLATSCVRSQKERLRVTVQVLLGTKPGPETPSSFLRRYLGARGNRFMSDHRLRSFFAPSTGDTLLASASRCELTLHRRPPALLADDDDPAAANQADAGVELSFELCGELRASSHTAGQLLAALVRDFQTPPRPRQDGGAA
jgi:hypothetical protein